MCPEKDNEAGKGLQHKSDEGQQKELGGLFSAGRRKKNKTPTFTVYGCIERIPYLYVGS